MFWTIESGRDRKDIYVDRHMSYICNIYVYINLERGKERERDKRERERHRLGQLEWQYRHL